MEVARYLSGLQCQYQVLVEHDLALLDYLSDYLCLIWGDSGSYGAVSHPTSTADAINQYLDGYLPAENLRIRPDPLSFQIREEEQLVKGQGGASLCSYPTFTLTQGDFRLTVEGGELKRSEIVVLLGENGTGKTSLVRVLAGQLQPDRVEGNEEVEGNEKVDDSWRSLNISLKPQMVKPTFPGKVSELLETKLGSRFHHYGFQNDVVRPLGIDRLLDHQVTKLSGGEKQRVAICLCLGKPADLYLLDEPSAFLDCEQRVAVSKAIKRFILNSGRTAVVVEHDFMMACYLADRVVYYRGEPGVQAQASTPLSPAEGINNFLQLLGITFRRDPISDRPRINKLGSQKDQQQKKSQRYF